MATGAFDEAMLEQFIRPRANQNIRPSHLPPSSRSRYATPCVTAQADWLNPPQSRGEPHVCSSRPFY